MIATLRRRLACGSALALAGACTWVPAVASADQSVGMLSQGQSVFWDGAYVSSERVADPSLCGVEGPCIDYKLNVSGHAKVLRVALRTAAFPVIDSMAASGLIHEAVTKGGWYLGIGSNLEDAGVPAVSFIAGPNYLVATGPTQTDGFIKTLNPDLAAQQVRWCIDLLGRLDSLPRQQLSAGDTTAFTAKSQLPPAPSLP